MAEIYKSVTELMKTARGSKALQQSLGDITDFQKVIDDTPTADVVPVVRCKECKYCRKPKGKERYRYFEGVLICESYEMSDDVCAVNPDDYCSYGERRDIK